MKSNLDMDKLNKILNQIADAQGKKVIYQLSASSNKYYETDNRMYQEWCMVHGYNAYPSKEEELAVYVATLILEGYKSSTVIRKIAAIRYAHLAQGYLVPNTKMIYSIINGSKEALKTDRTSKKKLNKRDFNSMLDATPDSLKGIRDKALLLLKYHSKMLREEIVAINVEDLDFSNEENYVRIRYRRQSGGIKRFGYDKNEYVILKMQKENCPVSALREWLVTSGILLGALFRPINKGGNIINSRLTGKAVALIVKEYAKKIGLDEKLYSSSSLK
ncbi:Site-specific recombinase XerD [Paenibacillus polysaccharolyticus]|uniref:Site-specific recombinase XerD n=1 Tax=Paenibacillus polysaccharolyticus TaxID=582692 RepID=A0A1G5GS08_9BACL|nr:hypothetical protein [Paenibacillus polysaccharolyticus]SCY54139.1 Site-specific recombinase XerD [Paenibacillus polysaccharolyticus]